MALFDVLGWVAASVGMSIAVPQLVRLWRSRTSAGLSLVLWQLNACATAAWAMHGFYAGAVQLQIPNLVCTTLYLSVVWFMVRDRNQALLPKLILPAVLAVALFGLDLWLGPVVFGFVVAAPLLFGQGAQLQYMRRSTDLSGVSVTTLVVQVICQSLWLTWAIGVTELAMLVCASLMLVLCLANLGYYGWRASVGANRRHHVGETANVSAEAVA